MDHVLKIAEISVDAITDPSRWDDLTDVIAETYGMRSSMIFAFPLEPRPRPRPFISEFLREHEDELMQPFQKGMDAADRPAFERLARLPEQRLYPETQLFGVESEDDLPPSEAREVLTRLGGVRSRLAAKLNRSGPWLDTLALHNARALSRVDDTVFREIDLVAPTISKSLNTYRLMASLQARYGAKIAALEKLSFGAGLVDAAGRLLYANGALEEMLGERTGLMRTQGRLTVASAAHHAAVAEAVRLACDIGGALDTPVPETFLVPKGGGPPYYVEIHALSDGAEETDIAGRFALVLVANPGQAAVLSLTAVAALGRLTLAETAICEGLLAGRTPREIAAARDVSVETVRKQIKSAQGKLGCRSRGDLFQIAMATSLPVVK